MEVMSLSNRIRATLLVSVLVLFALISIIPAEASPDVYVNKNDTPVSLPGGDTISEPGLDTNAGTTPDTPVRTITRALDIASADSDIFVGPGVYGETIAIGDEGITLYGLSGADSPVIRDTGFGATSPAVDITASGVTMDSFAIENFANGGITASDTFTLTNVTIETTGGTGVSVNGSNVDMDTVTIKKNGGEGIVLQGGPSASLTNVNVKGNGSGGVGLKLDSFSDASVDSAVVNNNGGTGVVLRNGEGNQFEKMDVQNNTGDGFLSNSHDSGVYRNITVTKNGGDGMQFGTSDNVLVEDVRSDTNGSGASDNGFTFRNSDDAIIRSDTASGNGGDGLFVKNSSGDSVTDLTVRDNDLNGVTLEESSNLDFDTSVVEDNGQHGVELTAVDTAVVSGLLIKNPDTLGNDGFLVRDSSNLDFRKNEITQVGTNSGDWAFDVRNSPNSDFSRNYVGSVGNGGLSFDDSEKLNFQRNEIQESNSSNKLIEMDGSTDFDSFVHNNFAEGSSNSVVNDDIDDNINLRYNYWGTSDEAAVRSITQEIKFDLVTPYRFTKIDTQTSDIRLRAAPAIPESVQADTSISKQIELSWTQPDRMQGGFGSAERNNEFRIYRSDTNTLDEISDWRTEADTFRIRNSSDTTFTDTGLSSDSEYFYRVTAWDTHDNNGRNFKAESYFSTEIKASPEDYGTEIYVNDDDTSGDTFTERTGDDTKNGTPQHPLRTLSRAVEVSEPGDEIYFDAGTYTDTAVIDDTGGVSFIGAGTSSTIFDGSSVNGAFLETNHTSDGAVSIRNLRIENADTGILVNGDEPTRLVNLRVEGGVTGVSVTGSTSDTVINSLITDNQVGVDLSGDNTYLAQNQIESNFDYQVQVGGSDNTIRRNNIIPSATNPDSGTSGSGDLTYNWWNTQDSSVIRARAGNTNYIPFRLAKVDTGVGADSVAPDIDMPAIDTGIAQQITLSWSKPTQDEDSSPLTGLEGYRIYRLRNERDTNNWSSNENKLKEITDPDRTIYTDTDILKEEGYFYRITAFDTNVPENESYFSDVVRGTWVNRPPEADSIATRTQVDSPIKLVLSGSDTDGDTLAYSIAEHPDSGTLDTTAVDVAEGIDTRLIYRPDTGVAGPDTFVFRVEDGDGGSDTATVMIRILVETSIKVEEFRVDGQDTPLHSGDTNTFHARVLFRNTKTGPGAVIRDSSAIVIRDGLGEIVNDSFNISVDTRVQVNGMDTKYARWEMDLPGSGDMGPFGNFTVDLDYDTEHMIVENVLQGNRKEIDTPLRKTRKIKILPAPVTYDDNQTIDTAAVRLQSVEVDFGQFNDDNFIDTGVTADGDSVSLYRMVQRGGTQAVNNPIVNPRYREVSADGFDTELNNAVNDLKDLRNREEADFNTRNLELLPRDLMMITLWMNEPLGDKNMISPDNYLGDSNVLQEPSTVRVRNVRFTGKTERLSVVKLLPEKSNGDWKWVEVDDLSDPGDVTGSEGNYTIQFDVPSDIGFSVFQIVVTGVVKNAPADEAVVYPNPFVPFDGNERTGCYQGGSCGNRRGIHFGAGQDEGFPPGTDIKIYTIKGELIDEFTLFNGGIYQWDARTRNGDPVASGVYIYRIETPDGSELNGKFAIVR